MLGKEMLDGGFGQFRTITQQVCWKRGKYFSVVDARGSSQTCPNCGVHVKKDLSVRVHNCPECSYEADRDVAAAQVLKNRGIEKISTAGLVGKETA
jgi:putative transposase